MLNPERIQEGSCAGVKRVGVGLKDRINVCSPLPWGRRPTVTVQKKGLYRGVVEPRSPRFKA